MYSNNIMPQYRMNMPRGGFRNIRNNGDRFFGGGFAVPFILGGITGGILSRPGGFGPNYPAPYPYPLPMPYYAPNNYPSYTENYYYY